MGTAVGIATVALAIGTETEAATGAEGIRTTRTGAATTKIETRIGVDLETGTRMTRRTGTKIERRTRIGRKRRTGTRTEMTIRRVRTAKEKRIERKKTNARR